MSASSASATATSASAAADSAASCVALSSATRARAARPRCIAWSFVAAACSSSVPVISSAAANRSASAASAASRSAAATAATASFAADSAVSRSALSRSTSARAARPRCIAWSFVAAAISSSVPSKGASCVDSREARDERGGRGGRQTRDGVRRSGGGWGRRALGLCPFRNCVRRAGLLAGGAHLVTHGSRALSRERPLLLALAQVSISHTRPCRRRGERCAAAHTRSGAAIRPRFRSGKAVVFLALITFVSDSAGARIPNRVARGRGRKVARVHSSARWSSSRSRAS